MGYEQDFVMRMIHDMVRAVCRMVLGKAEPGYELQKEGACTDTDFTWEKIKRMADLGEINEAENLLYEELKEGDFQYLEMALSFYSYLNTYTDEFLSAHHYSRKEILEGVEDFSKIYGVSGLQNLNGLFSEF